jgi:hypothetical protein
MSDNGSILPFDASIRRTRRFRPSATCGLAPAFLIASAIASSKPCDMRGFGRRGLAAPDTGTAYPTDYQRAEALRRRDNGETLTSIARSYAVDHSMISRLR